MDDKLQRLKLDGQLYAMSDLPPVAQDTLVSLQFVEARLQQLRGEMAVSQTGHIAYARAVKAELAQIESPLSSTTPSP